MLSRLLGLLLGLLLLAPSDDAQVERHIDPTARGPELSAWLVDGPRIRRRDQTRLRISAWDGANRRISVRLLNPPPGLAFPAVRNRRSPVELDLVWRVPGTWSGRRVLTFEVSNGVTTRRENLIVDIDGFSEGNGLFVGDVTGDGILDTVATAGRANTGGVLGAGGLYVWAGSSATPFAPTARLVSPSSPTFTGLGRESPLLVDLDRDGTLDILAGASRFAGGNFISALLFWKGGAGLQGTRTPDAVLTPPDPTTGAFSSSPGWNLRFADLNRDGKDDLMASGNEAIYVWNGAGDFAGTVAPAVSLVLSASATGKLGSARGLPFLIGDVTGDGWPDVVSGASDAAIAGVTNAGAVYVWHGGPGFVGTLTESATLFVPGASTSDRLGGTIQAGLSDGIRLGDINGDGTQDIVVAAPDVDVAGARDQGAAYVWLGGTLSGSVAPFATLVQSNGAAFHRLGIGGLDLQDLTGDGRLDVCLASYETPVGGVPGVGSMFLWSGTQLAAGTQTETAVLQPGSSSRARLSYAGGFDRVRVLEFRDFDADGITDLLAVCNDATARGTTNAGAIYFWRGGPAIVGARPPTATLSVPGAVSGDRLGSLTGHEMHFGDVTGDGVIDLVSGSYFASSNFTNHSQGRLYVWPGGVPLAGNVDPVSTLRLANPHTNDLLGQLPYGVSLPGQRQAVQLADVTSDGVLDIVCAGLLVDDDTSQDVGAIAIWAGGTALTGTRLPTAMLWGEANAFDALGQMSGQSVHFADFDDDGHLDIVSGTTRVDRPGPIYDVGAYYVWGGGPELIGDTSPASILELTSPDPFDQVGYSYGEGLRLGDITGDSTLDVIGSSIYVDVNSVANAGGVYSWSGADLCPGICTQDASLIVPGAGEDDRLTGH